MSAEGGGAGGGTSSQGPLALDGALPAAAPRLDGEVSSGQEGTGGAAPPLTLRPPPPLAKRLNRNALTVAAALAGVTVLTVLVVTRSPRPNVSSSAAAFPNQAAPPVPARPAFLDQPPRPLPTRNVEAAPGELGIGQGGGLAGSADSARVARADSARTAVLRTETDRARAAGATLPIPPPLIDEASTVGAPVTASGLVRQGPSTMGASRHETYQAALLSAVLVGDHHRGPGGTAPPGGGGMLSDLPPETGAVPPFALAGPPPPDPQRTDAAPHGPAGASMPGPAATAAIQASAISAGAPAFASPMRVDSAGSPYTIRAGTLIAGLLITGINSDLPGEVLGQTSRDVYDSRTQQSLLVPRGSRLIGSYDNRSVGTGRLIVSWTRLILPDGRSMPLPRLAGTDEQGQAGLHDQVDHHYGRIYGAALLTSVLTAGVQLSQPQQSGLYAAPSSRQVAAGALGQTMGDVGLESARRGLDVLPTVVIRPGQSFNVFLAGDLTLPGPYVSEGEGGL